MLQVYKNTNAPPEKRPDLSTQAEMDLGFKIPGISFRNRAAPSGALGGMGAWQRL
jgi:hypothetical protein